MVVGLKRGVRIVEGEIERGGQVAGTVLAADLAMATVIGTPGRYATLRSIRAFQRMLLTTMMLLFAVGVFEGFVLSSFFSRIFLSPWIALLAPIVGGLTVWRLCAAQNRRIDDYERERMSWKSGAEGECVVGSALERLPKEFVVLHDFNTAQGNFDHLVIGPPGIFAIETKNWRGTITSGVDGELVHDGVPLSRPYVKLFVRRIMAVREKAITLAGCEVFIKGVMVFPKARVQAKFGSTQSVHCLRESQLCDYIRDAKPGRRLTNEQIDVFRRAFTGIAGMDPDFSIPALAGVLRETGSREREGISIIAEGF